MSGLPGKILHVYRDVTGAETERRMFVLQLVGDKASTPVPAISLWVQFFTTVPHHTVGLRTSPQLAGIKSSFYSINCSTFPNFLL